MTSRAQIENVQISCAGGERYREETAALGALYGALLGMGRYNLRYEKLRRPDGVLPEIGFESDDGGMEVRPRWPDPAFPQQV